MSAQNCMNISKQKFILSIPPELHYYLKLLFNLCHGANHCNMNNVKSDLALDVNYMSGLKV